MSELITYRLDEIADVIDCEHKTAPKVDSSEYYSIRTPDIKNGRLLYEQANRVSAETYALWTKRGIPEAGDIILAREAPVGEVGWIDKDHKICLGQRTVLIKIHSTEIDKKYLLYSFVSSKFKDYLNELSGGSVVAHLNMKDIRALEFSFPPLPEQKAIASVLSSLDDKIDLLHRQNKTLEAMAETLFRQWFIEEAKEDWEDKPLSSIATFTNGLACQKYPPQPNEPKLPVLKIKDLTSGISDSSDWATANVDSKYLVNHGDVIFAWSASLMVKIWSGETCVLNQHLFNVTSDEFPKWFYYQWCKYHLEEFISISQSHATTMGHIKRKDLDEAMVKIPSPSELESMSLQFVPLMDKLITNLKQIQTLENLRDTLLPKLMSGEVRVQYQTEQVA